MRLARELRIYAVATRRVLSVRSNQSRARQEGGSSSSAVVSTGSLTVAVLISALRWWRVESVSGPDRGRSESSGSRRHGTGTCQAIADLIEQHLIPKEESVAK